MIIATDKVTPNAINFMFKGKTNLTSCSYAQTYMHVDIIVANMLPCMCKYSAFVRVFNSQLIVSGYIGLLFYEHSVLAIASR